MNDMLNDKEAAKVLGVTTLMLQRWRLKGVGPRYIKYGEGRTSPVRYQRSDLEAYKAQQTIEPKGSEGNDAAGQR